MVRRVIAIALVLVMAGAGYSQDRGRYAGPDKTKGTATLTIAAADADQEVRNQADYRCDGTNDETEIAAAIAKLKTTGGIIQLSDGTFTFNGEVQFTSGSASTDYSGITIRGAGMNATTLSGDLGASIYNCFFDIRGGSSGATTTGFTISDLTMDTTSGTTTHNAISLAGYNNLDWFRFERIRFIDDNASSVTLGLDNANNSKKYVVIKDCEFFGNADNQYAIVMKKVDHAWVTGCYFYQADGTSYNALAIYGDSHHIVVKDNVFKGLWGHTPISVSGSSYVTISGNLIEAARCGDAADNVESAIDIEWKTGHDSTDTAKYVTVMNNVISASGTPSGSGAKQHGIIIRECDEETGHADPAHITITGNVITGVQDNGIWLSDSAHAVVSANVITGCAGSIIIEDTDNANPVVIGNSISNCTVNAIDEGNSAGKVVASNYVEAD